MRRSRSSGLATSRAPAASPATIMKPRKKRLIGVRVPIASCPLSAVSGRARGILAERSLRGGEPRDRHAERRARHVIEPDLVAERNRCRIAAVLAADAELQAIARLAAAVGCDPDQLAHALAIERDKRIDGQNSLRRIETEKAR